MAKRRSDGFAEKAFDAVSKQKMVTAECKSRAREFPALLQQSGLLAAVVQYKAKGTDAHKFVLKAVYDALGLSDDYHKVLVATTNAQYRQYCDDARQFSWWLKRAAEATWSDPPGGVDNG